MVNPVDLPAMRRRSTGEAVATEDARAAWAVAAHEVLVSVAQTYNATITYAELAQEVQERTEVVTRQLMRYWNGDGPGSGRRCVRRGR